MCKDCGCSLGKNEEGNKEETPREVAERLVENDSTWTGQRVEDVEQLVKEGSINSNGH